MENTPLRGGGNINLCHQIENIKRGRERRGREKRRK
jgi:hypothetical protein